MFDTKNIVLIGFMGAGKSAAAKLLAQKLGRNVLSTDALIVDAEGRSITDIFRDSGEPYFRQKEKEIVRQVAQNQTVIIDCGGGVVLDPENVRCMKKSGVLFYLQATPEEIFRRVANEKHRPLLNTENPQEQIRALLNKRAPLYAQADHTIDTTQKSVDQVCEQIMALMTK